MRGRLLGPSRWILAGVLILAAMSFAFVQEGLADPDDGQMEAAYGGTCSSTTNCSQSSFCYTVPNQNQSIYYYYHGGGTRWFDPDADYSLGKCRTETFHGGVTNCVGGFTFDSYWWICS